MGVKLPPKKLSKLTFRALALPHSLWQNARSVSVAIFYGGNLTRIKSFDAKFSCFSSLMKRLHRFFRNLTILWLNYVVHVPVGGLNPRWHLWLRLPSNFSDFSAALVVLLHRTDSTSQWKDKWDLVEITQWIFMVCGVMEFLFECSTRYHTRVEHITRNSISPSNHVLFCLLHKHPTNKKKSNLFTCCHSLVAANIN